MGGEQDTRTEEGILARILEGLDHGPLDPTELRAGFPGHERTALRLLRAAERYCAERDALAEGVHPELLLPPGTVLGDFEVESFLGRGGMGWVFRARQRSLGNREVALKVLLTRAMPEARREQFRQEALAASSLHHPHLAAVHGFGHEGDVLFYAMDLIPGPSLREVLERLAAQPALVGDPAVQRVLVERIAEIASALGAIHSAGMVHLDVKPGNILLRPGTEAAAGIPSQGAVLVDFGLAYLPVEDGLGVSGGIQGATPAYAAPEQLAGVRNDPRSDIFNLGVVLYDLLAARLPAQRTAAAAGLAPISESRPGMDPDLQAILANAVACDPGRRYPSAALFQADLEAWLADEPIAVRRPTRRERLRRWIRHNPARLIRLAAAGPAVLALLAAGGFFVADLLRTRSALAEAFRSGGLEDFGRLVADGSLLPNWLAIPGKEPRELARLLREEPPATAEAVAFHELQAGRIGSGFLTMAQEVDREGWSARPFLSRAILSYFREARLSPAEAAGTVRIEALRTAGLLYYHRPDLSPGDAERSAGYRAAFLRTLADETPEQGRLYALAGLGGCATPAEIPVLLDWALGKDRSFEETRLGLRSVEFIVRRSHACGSTAAAAQVDWEAILPRLAPTCASAHHDLERGNLVLEVRELLRAVLLACRAGRGPLPDFAPIQTLLEQEDWTTLRAIAGDPTIVPFLASPSACVELEPEPWGRLVTYLGHPRIWLLALLHYQSQACSGCRSDPNALRQFLTGCATAAAEAKGIRPEFDPDPESRPGMVPRQVEAPAAQDLLKEAGEGTGIEWCFEDVPRILGGDSLGLAHVLTQEGELGSDESRVRLVAPGASRITLGFVVPEETSFRTWNLTVKVIKRRRAHLPYLGDASLELALDGSFLQPLPVRETRVHELPVSLPSYLLCPGKHEISLALDSSSTTTVNVFRVTLVPEPK